VTRPVAMGIDPSLTATGIAWGNRNALTLKTRAKDGDRRLNLIRDSVAYYVGQVRPTLVVMEDLPRNAMAAGVTGMAQGAVRIALNERPVPYALVVAASLKMYATGNGGADKADMATAARHGAGVVLGDNNQVDAWWLWAMAMDALGCPVVTVPTLQRESLSLVTWPGWVLEAGHVPPLRDRRERTRDLARARRAPRTVDT
jgi:Holliday junction resolvasome RuvABC endonuclease subunit